MAANITGQLQILPPVVWYYICFYQGFKTHCWSPIPKNEWMLKDFFSNPGWKTMACCTEQFLLSNWQTEGKKHSGTWRRWKFLIWKSLIKIGQCFLSVRCPMFLVCTMSLGWWCLWHHHPKLTAGARPRAASGINLLSCLLCTRDPQLQGYSEVASATMEKRARPVKLVKLFQLSELR